MSKFRLRIEQRDIDKFGSHCTDCPVASALGRQFPNIGFRVLAGQITFCLATGDVVFVNTSRRLMKWIDNYDKWRRNHVLGLFAYNSPPVSATFMLEIKDNRVAVNPKRRSIPP